MRCEKPPMNKTSNTRRHVKSNVGIALTVASKRRPCVSGARAPCATFVVQHARAKSAARYFIIYTLVVVGTDGGYQPGRESMVAGAPHHATRRIAHEHVYIRIRRAIYKDGHHRITLHYLSVTIPSLARAIFVPVSLEAHRTLDVTCGIM
jgi:hypothetical protein